MSFQNHNIDPTYFYDAIEQFAFDYKIFVNDGFTVDDYGKRVQKYNMTTIRGSLQSTGTRLIQDKSGNTRVKSYNFYCKSLYRIDIGDIIKYKDNYVRCVSVHDYDEHGVRSCELHMITLTTHKDFAEYIKYIEGEKLV